MTRLPLLSLCFLFLSSASIGQIAYGPKAGVNISSVSFSNEDYTTKSKTGFYAGVFMQYKFAKAMSVQADVIYSLEGAKEELTNGGSSGEITNSFLQVPVLFQYSFVPAFYVEAGPQLGILLSSKEDFGTLSNTNLTEYYNTFDFRFPVGLGYNISAVSGLAVNARYSFAFSSTNKVPVSGGDPKSSNFSVGLQYAIPVMKK